MWRRILLWRWRRPRRWLRYGLLTLIGLGATWGASLSYLHFTPPAYTSEWLVLLPGSGAGASVSLLEVGHIASNSSSPYGSHDISPKVNYQHIATSPRVLALAARRLDLTPKKLGKPTIKHWPMTAILQFKISGPSPEQAQAKALALHQALLDTLDQLRDDEIQRRADSAARQLDAFQRRVIAARGALTAFQIAQQLRNEQQNETLAQALWQLRQQQTDARIRCAGLRAQAAQLGAQLRLTARQAADALQLQNDPVYQRHLDHFAEIDAKLTLARAKWGRKHPQVQTLRAEREKVVAGMQRRGKQLIGEGRERQLAQLNLKANSLRAGLSHELVKLDAEIHAEQQRIAERARQIEARQAELDRQTARLETLERLRREYQIADAALSSSLAQIDAGRTDRYASYPLLQLLDPPDLPEKPSAPKKKYALLGAIAASLFLMTGLALLWVRAPLIRLALDE